MSATESFQTVFTRLQQKATPQLVPINIAADGLLYVSMPSHFFRYSPVLENEFYSNNDELITVSSSRVIGQHKFSSSNSSSVMANPPYPFQFDVDLQSNKKIGAPFAQDLKLSSNQFACLKNGALLLSCGHWDSSIKCTWMDNVHPVQSLNKHKDLVTCLALGVDGKLFVSGSKDTTVLVWEIIYQKGLPVRVDENPMHILYGHDDEITCIAVDVGLDVCVSGSNDGSCIIHNLRQGTYLRTIFHPQKHPISIVAISPNGNIIFYSKVRAASEISVFSNSMLASGLIMILTLYFRRIC
jgi:WD40 repeat protein